MANTDEFKIITEVELDSKEAEDKLESFIKNNKDKSIPIKVELKELSEALDGDLKDLGKKISESLSIDPKNVENIQKLESSLKNVKEYLKDMSGILGDKKLQIIDEDDVDSKMFERSAKALDTYAKKIEEGSEKIEKARKKINDSNTSKPTEIDVDVDKAKTKLEQFGNQIEVLKYKFNNLDINFIGTENLGKIEKELENVYRKAEKNAFSGNTIKSPEVDLDMKNLNEMYRLLKKIQTQYEKFDNLKIDLGDNFDKGSLDAIEKEIEDIIRQVSEMRNLKLGFNADEAIGSFKRLNDGLSSSKNEFSSLKQVAKDFKDELATYTLGNILGDWVTDFARSVGEAYLELDRSIREIKKVAEPSDINTPEKLDEIREKAIEVAKEVGMSSVDVQNSIASALQAGIGGMQESIEVAKQSMILANVGDMSQDSASQAINTVVKSFNLDPLKEYDIQVGKSKEKTTELKNAMDLLNFAGNNYAIGTDGIAEAMKRGGAVLSTYNVSLEDSVGLITATNEALQDPARVGNGLKTIAINLAGMKANAKDGTLEMNKTAKALQEIAGVDVYKNKKTGELKNMVEVLDEVKKKWDKLSDAEQKGLSEAIAGKQQATVFQSLMGNYEAFNKMRKEFANGDHFGSAEKENEQFVNSIDGKLNKLKETWVDTFTTIVNSDFTYKLLDGLIAISEAINGLVDSASQMEGGLSALLGASFFGFKGGLNGLLGEKDGFLNLIFGGYGNKNRDKRFFRESKRDLREGVQDIIEDAVSVGEESSKGLFNFGGFKNSIKEFGNSWKSGDKGLKSIGKGIKNIIGSSVGLETIGNTLTGLFGGLAKGRAIGLAIEGVTRIISAIDKFNRRHEIADQEHQEKIDALKEEIHSYEEQKKALEGLSEEYEELAKKTNRTAEEEERYLEIRKEIAELMPELVVGQDEEGNPLLALGNSLDGIIEQLDIAIDRKKELLLVEENNQADNALELGKSNNVNTNLSLNDFNTKMKELERNVFRDSLNEDGIFDSKNFDKKLSEARKYLDNRSKIYQEANQQLQNYYAEREKINGKVNKKVTNELMNDTRYSSYKEADDKVKGQVNSLMQLVDWSHIDLPNQSKLTKGFDYLAKNLSKNGGDITKYLNMIRDARINFNASGDEEQFTLELERAVKSLSELTGIPVDKLAGYFKGARSEMSLFDEQVSRFLQANGKSFADFVNGDEGASNLVRQFQNLDSFVQEFLNGTETMTKEYLINVKATLPQKVQDIIGAEGQGGLLGDGKLTEIEKQIMLKVAYQVQEEGDLNEEDKKFLQDIMQGKISPDKINKGLVGLNGEEFISKDLLIQLATETQGAVDKLKETEKKTEEAKGIFEKIKNWWNKFIGGTKDSPTEKSFKPSVGANFDVEETTKGLDDAYQKINKKITDFVNKIHKKLTSFNLKEKISTWFKNLFKGNDSGKSNKEIESVNVKVKEPKIELPKINVWVKIKNWFKNLFKGNGNGKGKNTTTKIETGKVEVKEPKLELPKIDIWGKITGWFKNLFKGNSKNKEKSVDVGTVKVKEPKIELPKINIWDKIKLFISGLFSKFNKAKVKVESPPVKINKPKLEMPKFNLVDEIKKKINVANQISKDVILKINTKTSTNIKNVTEQIKKELNNIKDTKITVTTNIKKAKSNIETLIKKSKEFSGKTFHASFIAHTAHAYNKIKALITKAKQYSGKTFHASFIAHTAHAYSKISNLLKKAQSYGGKTYHASMTVTKNVVTNDKGSKSAPASVNDATRTVTTTYANDGIMPIDEPTTIDDSSVSGKARNSNVFSYNFSEATKLLKIPQNIIKDAFSAMHEMVNKAIKETVGKTTKLADVLKNGTKVVLTSITNNIKDILDSLKFDINRLQELDNTISRISHSIDMLDKRLSNSVGSERIAFLQRQNVELKKRIKLNEELLKQKKREKEAYKEELKKKGLKFTADDNMSNYEETMLKLKRESEKLDKENEKMSENSQKRNEELQKAEEKRRKELEKRNEKQDKADEKRKKEIEQRKKEIEELIKLMDAFNKVAFGDIFDIESSIIDDSNKVEENLLEQKQIEYEKWVVRLESAFKNVNKELQKLNNQLSMLDIQMEHAWGKEKLDLMNKQIELIKKSQSALKDNITVMESSKNSVKNKLMEYGFKFNQNGDIENFARTMEHLKNTSKEFDTIQGLVDGYFDLYLEQIPEAERELAQFTNKIKDIYKEQLNATKELEDKIIDMYKKQLEERKKLIDEELDKRLDALKKEQDAYKKTREEQKYKDEFNEQTDKIKDLEKQIDLARKDTSLTGQKKLKDLLKQLEDEKKALDKITQDRIDQQVDDAFQAEEDRLQQGADDEKDRLDKEFSDEELLKKAQEAIKNGLFIGIDGEVKNLQSALLEYIDKWEEGLSATGALIKSEWITKLVTANDLIKDYAGKLEDLGIGNLNTNDIYTKGIRTMLSDNENSAVKSINFNEPLVVVQGSVNDGNIDQIEKVIKNAIDKNTKEILRKI